MVRHPWLLLLPIVLDLFFWSGPPLVMSEGLIERIVAPFDPTGPNAAALSGELAADLPAMVETLRAQLSSLNLWTLLIPVLLFWPTVLAGQGAGTAMLPAWQVSSLGQVLLISLSLMALGLALNVFWLHGLARSLREQPWLAQIVTVLRQSLRHALRLVAIGLLLLAALLGFLVPATFGLALVSLLVPALGQLLTSLLAIGTLWLSLWFMLHLYFTVAAVIVEDQGVLQAPWSSFQIVRRFFWSTLGFILISTLLSVGFQLIWVRIDASAMGRMISVLGNAMLGTAIALAMLIFFKQRFQLVQKSEVRGT
jgi:hypothetical protein